MHDEQFFQWLEADAKNTILFIDDPVSALKSACRNYRPTCLPSFRILL